MIKVENLTKRYAGITAVDGINFEVGKGEIVGFLGPNGAGKSTTMRILSCFLPPTSSIFQFTILSTGLTQGLIYGFVSLVFFGAIYTIGPKLIGDGWEGASRISLHLWLLVSGAGLVLLAAVLGGLVQGFALADPAVSFMNTVQFATPFRAVIAVGELVIFAGNCIFGSILVETLLREALTVSPAVAAEESLAATEEVSV